MSRPAPRTHAGGGIAGWSVRHPVGVVMLTLAVVVLGLASLGRLGVNLLPDLIYPEVRVRVVDPGVPAPIMEDLYTRQIEEQLAITEGAVSIRSTTSEGSSSVDLAFPYGKDIDLALRDASTRLDRARRFLPETEEPPYLYKRDPMQLPVLELVVGSALRDPVALRSWTDDVFAKWFLNLPGVAAAEVGGGLVRELHVLPELDRLAAHGLTLGELRERLAAANQDLPGGRLRSAERQLGSRTSGRFRSVAGLAAFPVRLADGSVIALSELARVIDTHQDETLRVRVDGMPGVKVSIQKQPTANTVAVVDAVRGRLAELQAQDLIPEGIDVIEVRNEAEFVRAALANARNTALSGALLAMLVVYLFLGDLRRTLVIGSAIPIAIATTFVFMDWAGLSLNVMTLGGLAVGIGMLVDSTIVMLENIQRHQAQGLGGVAAGETAASEVNSAIVAATSTNLAAILPFVFISGLIGLLFQALIITVSAAIIASLLVALTLVPALGTRIPQQSGGSLRAWLDGLIHTLETAYAGLVRGLLASGWRWLLPPLFLVLLVFSLQRLLGSGEEFLPEVDSGEVRVSITADPGISLAAMDAGVRRIEALLLADPRVARVFTVSGGFVFGRTEREFSNRASLQLQLQADARGRYHSADWVRQARQRVQGLELVGYVVRFSVSGIRGIRTGSGDEAVTTRIKGPELAVLDRLGRELARGMAEVDGISRPWYSGEEVRQELEVQIDRTRASVLGLSTEEVGTAVRLALDGQVVSDYLDGDRRHDIRLRLPYEQLHSPGRLKDLLLFPADRARPPVYLGDIADLGLIATPGDILRDQQTRMVEITASLDQRRPLSAVIADIQALIDGLDIPPGYSAYEAGAFEDLQRGRSTGLLLLGLALFLVYVVMAVQYESLRNPLIILIGVPFAATGVGLGLPLLGTPVSMPVWLGLIMLAGVVVNNAIVLVEYVEIARARGLAVQAAVIEAARLRLRPILMTTLTTVAGLTPLALGLGQGSEMLRPLGQTMLLGLSWSLLVSLLLIPLLYVLLHGPGARPQPGGVAR